VYNRRAMLRLLPIIAVLAAFISNNIIVNVTLPENERQQCVNITSTLRQQCVNSQSTVCQQCVNSASKVHQQCTNSASTLREQNVNNLHQQIIVPFWRNGSVRVDAVCDRRERHPGGVLPHTRRSYHTSRCISPSNYSSNVSSFSVGLLFYTNTQGLKANCDHT